MPSPQSSWAYSLNVCFAYLRDEIALKPEARKQAEERLHTTTVILSGISQDDRRTPCNISKTPEGTLVATISFKELLRKYGDVVDLNPPQSLLKLVRDGGKTVIAGLEQANFAGDTYRYSSMILGGAELWVLGDDVNYPEYPELMGLSGAAFRVQMAQPDWCPSAPNAYCGYDCVQPMLAALPRKLTLYDVKKDDPAGMKRLREMVVQSIDRGVPVLMASEECGLIVGYEAGGEHFLCRPYDAKGPGYVPMAEWPWVIGIFGEKRQINRRQAIDHSLEIALEVANTPKYDGYASGFAAYDAWSAGLLDEAALKRMNKGDFSATMLANAHTYASLADARQLRGTIPALLHP